MKWTLALLVSLPLLIGCASGGPATSGDSFCAVARPMYVSKDDVLTEPLARDILSHNEYGARKCGWKPTSK
jgi:hypothetical protein